MEFVKIVGPIVGPIVGLVGGEAWGPIKRHLGYLIFYERKIEKMKTKFDDLEAIWKDVERQVEEAACQRLEEVDSAVEAWLKKVKDADKEVKRIKDTNNKSFLHFCLHHGLGRQAAAQIKAIDDLLAKKGKFDRVSHSRPPPSTTGSLLVNEGYVMFESRKSYINKILDAFKDETVHMIGVYGMGGIGKTTLVKEVAKQAMKDGFFTEVVMVTVSQNLDMKKIQTGIAESLHLELKEDTVEVRAGKIEERLMGKEGNRVLVVLDDLWEMLELSKVRIPDLNKGTCRVVITTRREDVCDQMDCQKKVELRALSGEESWLLFKSRAGNVVESLTMKEVAGNVAKQCAGLPLALVVLGTALKGKKLDVWKTVLKQLKKSTIASDLPYVNEKVCESIALSYEYLGEAAKWCFLHCCLYPEDYDIKEKELMHMLVGGGLLENVESLHEAQDRVHVLMDQLKASGLLLQGRRKITVRMHDVVRDVAIWIGERSDHGFFVRAGQGLEEWPRNSDMKLQNCRRLSFMSNKIVDLPSDPMKCTELETLILCGNPELSNIPEKFFQHMRALKVLDLSYTQISCLPESLSCLTSLKVLNLRGCVKLEDISPINELKMLKILILKDTTTLSSSLSNVLRGCSRLEVLHMAKYEGCLAELSSLRFLTHLHISDGVVTSNDSLSKDMGSSRSWTKLQECQICFPPSLCNCLLFKNGSLHLKRTKHFSPSLKVLLEKIRRLALVYCQESEVISSKCDIPPHMFHNLTRLEVSDCLNLTSLGDEPLMFHLKLMDVKNCPKLASLLPSKVWQSMHHLETLEVTQCEAMLQLFPYDHKHVAMTELLPKLVGLNLSELPQLESVLQPFQCLPNLMTLKIQECPLRCGLAYYEMEMAVDPFPKLEKLEIYECMEMSQMISSSSLDALQGMRIFQNLSELVVARCPRLTHLFWSKQAKHMQQLTSLQIYNCDSLTAVVISNENQEEEASTSTSTSTTVCTVVDHHGSHSFFPRLTKLKLSKIPQLKSVLQPFQCLPNLMTLKIQECPLRCGLAYNEIEMAADPFPKLQKLEIYECMEMGQMISLSSPHALQDMCIFQNLSELVVARCPRLTHLFWSKQTKHMQQLTSLTISGCPSLSAVVISNENQEEGASTSTTACKVVDHHGSHSFFPRLTKLKLSELPQLESVLQPFQCLPNLMTLDISYCGLRCGLAYHVMEMVVDPFPKLEKLEIGECMEMRQMISSSSPDALQDMCIFQNLSVLVVVRCPRLTHLFWSKQAKHMQQLTSLQIYNCDSLTAVVISNENQEEGASVSTSTSSYTSTNACAVVDHHHGSQSFFPQLKDLLLLKLPKMVAFHQPTAFLMEWPCLEVHFIKECPKLETPLLGPQTSKRSRELLE
ncbi:hypothetical protein J5N97_009277 [Dioscorea zingiberensis]|uniref:AAA+ ATPase domain-containing protein n=1 Tax=Dioscorea zingiberensis TaxID=325984 RepID=A0A9D5CXW8_9LILI|nr:hypothetical protein J5N97_009277 [Dioscorea zingiberensis]